jgi:hypothetical protein
MSWGERSKAKKEYFMGNDEKHHCKGRGGMHNGTIYGMGFIGAAVYFIQQATGFWMGALGVLKAMVWPAVLVYKVFEMMKM